MPGLFSVRHAFADTDPYILVQFGLYKTNT